MRRRLFPFVAVAFLAWVVPAVGAEDGPLPAAALRRTAAVAVDDSTHRGRRFPFAEYFQDDPRNDWDAVVTGAAQARLEWQHSDPAWPGDRRGSLTALYDSSLPAGLFGFHLPRRLTERDAFTAAAAFVLDPDEFDSDPFGFAQISWGLWNTHTTGLNRTGNFSSFAGDTFDLLELDYFPNVSPDFGGPYLAPSIFGERTNGVPPDAFANASFAFGIEVALPLGVPLLAVIEHDPELGVAVIGVHRIVRNGRTTPIPGAVTVIDLSALAVRDYAFDAVGLTLWNDGFGGPTPAVRAKVDFHALVVELGLLPDVGGVLSLFPRRW